MSLSNTVEYVVMLLDLLRKNNLSTLTVFLYK